VPVRRAASVRILSCALLLGTLGTRIAAAEGAVPTRVSGWHLPSSTRQLVVGVAPDWDASTVQLQRFERSANGRWKAVGAAFPGRLGAHGLVWGRGINPRTADMTDKSEGDKRSPAGIFRLRQAFGYDAAWVARTKLPYVTVGPRDLLVEDPSSSLYNTHVHLDHDPSTPFERAQRMVRGDPAHRLQVMIDHNTQPRPVLGKGSAVMFHTWRRSGAQATAGCTSMADEDLDRLVSWLDPWKAPTYVLLPADEYRERTSSWSLPSSVAGLELTSSLSSESSQRP
jgi:L,D-peptidoglycan transpeptidase YkuD (ErfK/YbiS/YcfS/YnhG family)